MLEIFLVPLIHPASFPSTIKYIFYKMELILYLGDVLVHLGIYSGYMQRQQEVKAKASLEVILYLQYFRLHKPNHFRENFELRIM